MFQPNPSLCARVRLAALLALAIGALAFGAGPATAEDDLPATSQFFDEYDTNADGQVTQDEFRGSSEIFRLIDKDGDGVIKPAELGLPADYKPDPKTKKRRAGGEASGAKGQDPRRAAAREKFMKRLQAMDKNGDKRVGKDEWTGPAEAFGRMDRNKDGFIDAKDGRRGGNRKPKTDRKKKDGAGDMRGHDKADAERMLERAKQQFASLDKNSDGALTADEAPHPKLLEMADGDGNGSVSLQEFIGLMKKRARASGGDKPRDGQRDGQKRRRGGRVTTGMLRRWDRNDDGKVSAEEFPGQDAMFARLDVDKDGFLTEADVQANRKKGAGSEKPTTPTTPQKSGNLIEQQDMDGDGKLTRAEFKGTSEIWRLMDRNGDGFLTADELPKTSGK